MGMIYAPNTIIENGALINNVCHIYQSTKPTTRPDGSALVTGDKWYNPATGVDGFWSGTEWLGEPIIIGTGSYVATTTIQDSSSILLPNHRLTTFSYQYFNSGTIDSTNRWTFTVRGLRSDGAVGSGYTGLSAIPITVDAIGLSLLTTITANVLASSDHAQNVKGYRVSFTRSGTAGELFINTSAKYFRVLS